MLQQEHSIPSTATDAAVRFPFSFCGLFGLEATSNLLCKCASVTSTRGRAAIVFSLPTPPSMSLFSSFPWVVHVLQMPKQLAQGRREDVLPKSRRETGGWGCCPSPKRPTGGSSRALRGERGASRWWGLSALPLNVACIPVANACNSVCLSNLNTSRTCHCSFTWTHPSYVCFGLNLIVIGGQVLAVQREQGGST